MDIDSEMQQFKENENFVGDYSNPSEVNSGFILMPCYLLNKIIS